MPKQPDFIMLQQQFAQHIKDPETSSRPKDVDDRHMSIYRDLFFKNVMSFLTGAFPVLSEVMGPSRWLEVGRDFFSKHQSKTPYFLEISQEFLTYLETEYLPAESDPLYIYELAHYEWLELYVDVHPGGGVEDYSLDESALENVPILSEVVEGFLYQYPVHKISKENAFPEQKETALIVYRKLDDSVAFVETNPFTLQLLAIFKQSELTGLEALALLLNNSGLAHNEAAQQGGLDTLNQWQNLEIIIGSKKK